MYAVRTPERASPEMKPPDRSQTVKRRVRAKQLLPDIDRIGQYAQMTNPFTIQAAIKALLRQKNALQQQYDAESLEGGFGGQHQPGTFENARR